jgi:hypothetical protein
MSKEHKIQQQYYTRAREGIFRTNEGLDTVAKSPALDNNFIKKTLHPFCVYHSPQELSQRGEKDLLKYPESLTVFHADSGELVIGRSMYAGADFTGQRDTIFAHNYVVPKERKEEYLRSANHIFRIEHFQSQYDAQSGKVLPELEDIAHSLDSYLNDQQETLDKLGIDEKLFKQLLWAFMMSISSNKKVFIILDVDVAESSLYAKRLTELLFHCLPFELRSCFGFMTYDNEPQGKKFIDVMYVEKGSIRLGDRNLEKDYLFDFPNQRFVNVDLPGQVHYYLDYAWACKERPDKMTAFYMFAEEALQGIDNARKLVISTYYQLCALFLVEGGYSDVYSHNKEGVLKSILSYLNAETFNQKPRLYHLFHKLVRGEVILIQNGRVMSVEYLQAMMDYYKIAGEEVKQEFVSYLTLFLYNGWNHHDDSNHTIQVLQSMQRQQPELFKAVIRQMHGQEKLVRVFEDYVQGRVASITSTKGIQEEIMFWLNNYKEGVSGVYFQEQCLRKVQQILDKDRDKIAGGKHLYDFIKMLIKNSDSSILGSFCENFELVIAKSVLSQLELGQISAMDFENLAYLTVDPSITLKNSLSASEKEKLQVLRTVSVILRNQVSEVEILTNLEGMSQDQFGHTQNMLLKFLRDRVMLSQFENITYAFYRRSSGYFNDTNIPEYRYTELLNYIHSSSKENGEIYNFLVWTASNGNFQDRSNQIIGSYKKAIRSFIRQQGKGKIDKDAWKKLVTTQNKQFNELMKEIKLDQSNVFIQILARRKKQVIISTLIFLAATGLTLGSIYVYKKYEEIKIEAQRKADEQSKLVEQNKFENQQKLVEEPRIEEMKKQDEAVKLEDSNQPTSVEKKLTVPSPTK